MLEMTSGTGALVGAAAVALAWLIKEIVTPLIVDVLKQENRSSINNRETLQEIRTLMQAEIECLVRARASFEDLKVDTGHLIDDLLRSSDWPRMIKEWGEAHSRLGQAVRCSGGVRALATLYPAFNIFLNSDALMIRQAERYVPMMEQRQPRGILNAEVILALVEYSIDALHELVGDVSRAASKPVPASRH